MQFQDLAPGISRRGFVRALWLGSAVSLVSEAPWCGTVLADIQPVAFPPGGGVFRLRLSDFPPLTAAFGSVRLGFTPLNVAGPMAPFIVTRDGSAFTCFSAECTHAGCILPSFRASEGKIITCSCHGSRFAMDGSVVAGPARMPLLGYPTRLEDAEHLAIGLSDFPEYDVRVRTVVGAAPSRLALSFFALRQVEYQVLAGIPGGPLQPRAFSTTVGGSVNELSFKGTGVPQTLYVDQVEEAAVFVVSALVKAV